LIESSSQNLRITVLSGIDFRSLVSGGEVSRIFNDRGWNLNNNEGGAGVDNSNFFAADCRYSGDWAVRSRSAVSDGLDPCGGSGECGVFFNSRRDDGFNQRSACPCPVQ
jgi:hypothetical protein